MPPKKPDLEAQKKEF